MLSAKDEKNAIWATLLFNFMHYAIRPWPWILIALASIVVFPDLDSLRVAFPNTIVGNDLAYPAMISFLPPGLLGLLVASLIAAFMSTISTHLNWGSSYLVHDFYRRFFVKGKSETHYVSMGRVFTVLLMVFSAFAFTNAAQMFEVLLMVGAGTGLVYLLRWLWWRINAWSEIAASLTAILSSYLFTSKSTLPFADPFDWAVAMGPWNYVGPVILTTFVWLVVTFLTKPEESETLTRFANQTSPPGSGWDRFRTKERDANEPSMGSDLLKVFFGSAGILAVLIGTGLTIYRDYLPGIPLLVVGIFILIPLFRSPVNVD